MDLQVLHISTKDFSGAGKSALRLHRSLKASGCRSRMLVVEKRSGDNEVIALNRRHSFLARISRKVKERLISFEMKRYLGKMSYDVFSNERAIYALNAHPLVKSADIITLRWVATMLDYREFFSHCGNKIIVWRLSDVNPFTGGCHYPDGCARYQEECGCCPQLDSDNPRDLSYKIMMRKKRIFNERRIHLVAPGKWMARRLEKSALFNNYPLTIIPNGVATDIFHKVDKYDARASLGLPKEKTMVLFGTDYKTKRKGFKFLKEAMGILKGRRDASNLLFVTFGAQSYYASSGESKLPTIHIEYIEDEKKLSALYSSADFMVHPAIEDNLPNTVMESMACGTPVLVFKGGGADDILSDYDAGMVAEMKNSRDLAEKMEYLSSHPEECQRMGEIARTAISKEFTTRDEAQKYIDLYEQLRAQ